MKARAAVAWEPKKPLSIEMIDVEGPKQGEVLLKVVASGVCHTDAFTLSGDDPEGAFPCVLGHEGGCEVVECGPGVKDLKPSDHDGSFVEYMQDSYNGGPDYSFYKAIEPPDARKEQDICPQINTDKH